VALIAYHLASQELRLNMKEHHEHKSTKWLVKGVKTFVIKPFKVYKSLLKEVFLALNVSEHLVFDIVL